MLTHAFPADLKLDVRGLALARGGRAVLEDVSFTVCGGEALLVIGPNGAGKSTLLRALAGLLAPASGEIALSGGGSGEVPVQAHYIGHAEAMKSALSARENLAFWAQMLGEGDGLAPQAALERFSLPRVADLPVGWLSAGQKRRVALARLLVAPRPVWLLDEPATALDAAALAGFARLMSGHLAAGGLIVAATHAPLGLAGARELRLEGAP